jgi:transposase-like protein
MPLIRKALKRLHYPLDVIAQCVRWYLAYALSLRNLEEMMAIRQSKYLNNLVEQDHRNIKRRIRLMLGFKSFRRAQAILAGIELIHMIRKGQYQHSTGAHLSPAEQFYLLSG